MKQTRRPLEVERDNAMLLAYCRGGRECSNCLCRLGIMKIALSEI